MNKEKFEKKVIKKYGVESLELKDLPISKIKDLRVKNIEKYTKHQLEYFETVFLPRNFQHLSGLEFLDEQGNVRNNSVYFYRSCLSNTITEQQIRFKSDGTTPLKLAVLPQVVRFLEFSKMTVLYNGRRPKLALERLVGTTNYSVGFVQDGQYYVPSSCLQEDIRNLGDKPSQILAVLSKRADASEKQYKEVCYVAKGISLSNLKLPEELCAVQNADNPSPRPTPHPR